MENEFKKIKYVIEGQRDPDLFDHHCSRLYKKEVNMMKEELKAILQADVHSVDIHFDFNESAVGKVNIKFKGIPETFEYEYEDTSVHSMKINKLDTQLEELGSALVNKINRMAQVNSLIGSSKAFIKEDITRLKGANVLLNGKVIGKCTNFTKELYDGTQLLFNYIEMESDYKLGFTDESVRIVIANEYGEIYQDISGYLTEIRKLDNDNVLIVIKQEIIDF